MWREYERATKGRQAITWSKGLRQLLAMADRTDEEIAISVRFATATCRGCPARDKCTSAAWSGRQLFLRPREIH